MLQGKALKAYKTKICSSLQVKKIRWETKIMEHNVSKQNLNSEMGKKSCKIQKISSKTQIKLWLSCKSRREMTKKETVQ